MLLPLLLIFILPSSWADIKPFWKSKEKVYERIKQGEVIVSAKSKNDVLEVQGGGHVEAPREFVIAQTLDFENLPKASSYIEFAKFDAAAQKLKLKIAAFGHRAELLMKVKVDRNANPPRLEYEVLEGALVGMTGVLSFAEINPMRTEVGIFSQFNYGALSVPRIFVEFGFEVVFQRMAINLKNRVEHEYKNSKENRKTGL